MCPPRLREFELFCEGTSNPWGDRLGQRGKRLRQRLRHRPPLAPRPRPATTIRQGGPYPPFTWKIESIVKHRTRRRPIAASTISTATPIPPSIATSSTWATSTATASTSTGSRNGSTYRKGLGSRTSLGQRRLVHAGRAEDRARRLPVRPRLVRPLSLLSGRPPRPGRHRPARKAGSTACAIKTRRGPAKFDLAEGDRRQLIARLDSPNVFFRDMAQRLLAERNGAAEVQGSKFKVEVGKRLRSWKR